MHLLHLTALLLAGLSPAGATATHLSPAACGLEEQRPTPTLVTTTGVQATHKAQAGDSRATANKAMADKVKANKFAPSKSGVLLGDKLHSFDALPETLGSVARAAVLRARAWCEQTGAVAIPDEQERFVLVAPAGLAGKDRYLKVAVKTANWVDEELPQTDNQMPPLPEGQYQDDVFDPDGSAAILYILATEADQALLISQLAKEEPRLAEWSREASGLAGFHLLRPLCAGVVMQVKGNQEWSPEHEVANRTAKVLAQRRFGVLPYWFAEGLGWAAEWKHDKQLYCFSHRNEFIYTVEHGAWGLNVKRSFEKRKQTPLEPLELEELKRGQWNLAAAECSFGLTSWLLLQDAPKLSLALEALRVARDREDRQPLEDGGWMRIPGWELPASRWDEEFGRHFGADWRTRATKEIGKGLRTL